MKKFVSSLYIKTIKNILNRKRKMDLDPRIKDRKYIFDCFNSNLASKYIGEVCYLSNNIEEFSDLDMVDIDTLKYIGEGHFYGSDKQFAFCLPFEGIKEKEKEYKPFDPETFEQRYGIGFSIKYRRKGANNFVYKAMITATTFNEKTKEFFICMRGLVYTLDELFEDYELFEKGEWKPFGLEK